MMMMMMMKANTHITTLRTDASHTVNRNTRYITITHLITSMIFSPRLSPFVR